MYQYLNKNKNRNKNENKNTNTKNNKKHVLRPAGGKRVCFFKIVQGALAFPSKFRKGW